MCGYMEEGRWAVRTQYIGILVVTKKSSPNSSGLSVSVREHGGIATSEVNLILLLS